jgi:hypothetical protein
MILPNSIFKMIGVYGILTAILTGSTPCRATLFVLVCDNTQIVIASDSRRITMDHGQTRIQNGVEKVVSLRAGLARSEQQPYSDSLLLFRSIRTFQCPITHFN